MNTYETVLANLIANFCKMLEEETTPQTVTK